MQYFGGALGGGQRQPRTHGAHGLGNARGRLQIAHESDLGRIPLQNQRRYPEDGPVDQALEIGGGLDGVIEHFKEEGQRPTAKEPQHQRDRQIQEHLGLKFVARGLRLVDHGDVVGGDTRGDAHLFHPLQQTIIKLAVGVDLALECLKVGAARIEVEDIGFGDFNALEELDLLAQLGLVSGLNAIANGHDLSLDIGVDLVNLLLQLQHQRVARLVQLGRLLILLLDLRPLLF